MYQPASLALVCDRYEGGLGHNKVVNLSHYDEHAPDADLAEYVQSVWYRRVSASEAEQPARVVPDGCIDLIWMESGLVVAGPDRQAWTGPLASGAEIVGLRFRPGVAPPLLETPATELVDQRAALGDVCRSWARDLDQLQLETNADEMGNLLQDALRARLRQVTEVDRAAQYVASVLQRQHAETTARVDELADTVGLSERQLNRRCHEAFGYGPKLLARILRFQRFLSLAHSPKARPLAQLAADAGYADQAHLSREVKDLAGLTPAQLLAERDRRNRAGSAGVPPVPGEQRTAIELKPGTGGTPALPGAFLPQRRVQIDAVAIGIVHQRVTLAPEGVPGLLVPRVAGRRQAGVDLVDLRG